VLSYEALAENVQADELLARILSAVPVPEIPTLEGDLARASRRKPSEA